MSTCIQNNYLVCSITVLLHLWYISSPCLVQPADIPLIYRRPYYQQRGGFSVGSCRKALWKNYHFNLSFHSSIKMWRDCLCLLNWYCLFPQCKTFSNLYQCKECDDV